MAKSYRVGIVGESFYQKAIAGLRVGEVVSLRHEPGNPHDERAVAVLDGDGQKIGHLPLDHWLKDALLDEGKQPRATVAEIHDDPEGGTPTGVVIDVVLGAAGAKAGVLSTGRGQTTDHARVGRNRKAGFGCLFLIGLLALVAMCTPDAETPDAADPAVISPKTMPEEGIAASEDPGISAAEFAELRNGMSLAEAEAVIGGPGEVLSESELAGIHTVMLKWDGESGFGANANAMFQDGRLVSKAQFGLE